MAINDVANRINTLASGYRMARFQRLRKNIKSLSKIHTYQIFIPQTIDVNGEYAFHSGGRDEIQFNIGCETPNGPLRYGLAFSLQSSRSMPDPIGSLKSKIEVFNNIVTEGRFDFSCFSMWYYRGQNRSTTSSVKPIEADLVRLDTFIFIGKFTKDDIEHLSDQEYSEILQTFDQLLDLYVLVENHPHDQRIARVCWNDNNWMAPSGRAGKSTNKDSYECQHGFGHEEWILDTQRTIKGYHYGYLQEITNYWETYEGRVFDISLYAMKSPTNDRWWIGTITGAEVISHEVSAQMFTQYKRSGWLKDMESQLAGVGANSKALVGTSSNEFFNIRYRPEDLRLLDEPQMFSAKDPAVKSTYYTTLPNKKRAPRLEIPVDGEFHFSPGHKKRTKSTIVHYKERTNQIDSFHNEMQENVYNQLVTKYGSRNVGTEQRTGLGSLIDLVLKEKGSRTFFEFKTSNSLRECVREALAQLLEYAYFPNKSRATKLVITSQHKITPKVTKYFEKLRTEFKIPVYYRRYDQESKSLEDAEY